jgi:ribosome hibernation promoting factor
MEVTIRPRNFKLSADLERDIRRRVDRFPRHLEDVESAEVLLSQEPTRLTPQRLQYVAQLTLHTRNNVIRAEVTNPELLIAIDQVVDNMDRKVDRFRERRKRKGRAGLGKTSAEVTNGNAAAAQREGGAAVDEYTEEEEAAYGQIARVKHFTLRPVFPEEAIEQMELLGHDFFVFYNAASEQTCVVYRRTEGNYGLIEPELG